MDNRDYQDNPVVTGQIEPHAYKRTTRTVDRVWTRDTRVPHASMDNHDHQDYPVITGQIETHAYKRITCTVDRARTRFTRKSHVNHKPLVGSRLTGI